MPGYVSPYSDGMDDRGPVLGNGTDSFYRVQSGSGAHPASHPIGTGVTFPGDKTAAVWEGGEADHSPPSSVEV
jgi:hypothetical protein